MLYVVLIILAAVSLFLAIYLLFSQSRKKAYDKKPIIVTAISLFAFPLFLIIAITLGSDKLSLCSLVLPLSFVFIYRSVVSIIKFKNCTEPVKAEYVSYEMRGRRRAAPAFIYKYNGEVINAVSFLSYPNGKHKRLFSQDSEYKIYINPSAPMHCVDKRLRTCRLEVLLALSIVFLIVGIFLVIII